MLYKRKKTVRVLENPGKYFPKKSNKQVKNLYKSKVKVQPTVKDTNRLANLTHKNSSGANNWRTFIELQSKNSSRIKMDCSEEYTTPDTVLPAQSSSGLKSSTKSKYKTKINEKNLNIKANKQLNIGVAPKDNPSDKTRLTPSKKEYTTPDTVLPAQSSSGLKSSTKSKYKTKINEKNLNIKANKQLNNGVAPKDNPSDKTRLTPSKKGLDQRKKYSDKPRRNLDENGITNEVAIDCEMVGVEDGVKKDMLARVSIVNSHGNCIYDSFVKPVEPVVDYRTFVSGVRPKDLENAPDFAVVQKKVADILKDRILVGHGLKKDLAVLFLTHPRHLIRDTTKYHKFRKGLPPGLKKLAKEYLGVTIQEGEHSSVQDALAAMQLYKMFKKDWEDSLKRKRTKRHVKEKQVTNLQATVTRAMSLMDV